MARRAVRLLLAIVLATVLFHPDAVVEGKEAPERPEGVIPYHRCGTCEVTRLDVANSPVNKVPAISEIIGITENVCKPVADDVQAMKDYNGLVDFIKDYRPSIQQLKEFICEESPRSAEGEDHNKRKWIKNIGLKLKEAPLWIKKLLQTKNPINPANACEKLQRFPPEVKFYMTF